MNVQQSPFDRSRITADGDAISKHEGFRWVKGKRYSDKDLNPEVT